ncbi:MAG TPA: hypothetical protein VN778_05550 [Verrucomicrobiae bacterium]|nr:hypothetical protein [Verrucomicrobiae bacterium]
MQAKAFFNHGKVIGGLVSSVAVFRMRMNGPLDPNNEISEVVLQMQAKSIDKALELPLLQATNGTKGEQEVFEECTHLAKLAVRNPGNQFVNRRYMLRAAKSMSSLACQNVVLWLETSKQDEAESLPLLTIPDGGTPRSAGPRVEMLQPIFHQIIASEAFTRSS